MLGPRQCGTCSEVTKSAELDSSARGKAYNRHDSMFPIVRIIDPYFDRFLLTKRYHPVAHLCLYKL